MMKRINSSVALAVVLLLPALSWTQDKGDGAAGQTIKIAQANPSAAVKVSQRQMKQAHATFLADREAAKIACRNRGQGCDTAMAKVKADREALDTKMQRLQQALSQGREPVAAGKKQDSGQGRSQPRQQRDASAQQQVQGADQGGTSKPQ